MGSEASSSEHPTDFAATAFRVLDPDGRGTIDGAALWQRLTDCGLQVDDQRLAECAASLRAQGPGPIDSRGFHDLIQPSAVLIERALRGDLVIPDFPAFITSVEQLFQDSLEERSGEVADYIPQLGRVDPERFGLAICSLDGQRLALGDAAAPFCIQSTSKPINYCLALEQHGTEEVHHHVGREPSGRSFNELELDPDGLPHNPLINAGGIMSCALIGQGESRADRFERVMEMWTTLCGTRPGFDNAVYLSERQTADRNFALGYYLREKGAFPKGTDLVETLEFYFQCCSIELTAEAMAVAAATLAGGGIHPLTGKRVLQPETVQHCLTLMTSCGMYDDSGEWAFTVGLPAKSGVSGVILAVVPNVLGLCVQSPRLDHHGNSVRGTHFCRSLVQTFNFHHFDNLLGGRHAKLDPRRRTDQTRQDDSLALWWAAREGDVQELQRLMFRGVDLDQGNYEGRTALHVAAAAGQADAVGFLLQQRAARSARDHFGNTAADDAKRLGHGDVAAMLREI